MIKKSDYYLKDHIAVITNAFPIDMIDRYKKMLDTAIDMGLFWDRSNEDTDPLQKKDKAIGVVSGITQGVFEELKCHPTEKRFFDIFFNKHWKWYAQQYEVLQTISRHRIYDMKIQKTEPCEGYHVWHPEAGHKEWRDRIAVFSLFLNTLEEGGETEFLYQSTRVKPVENTLVIFPAGYTHAHRGNPPLKGTKYLLTGWIEWE